MRISAREMVLGWATMALIVAAGSYWFVAPKIQGAKEMSERRETLRRDIELSKRLLDQKPDWERRMELLRLKLKTYSPEKYVSADNMKLLENLAKESEIALLQRRPEKEKKQGDLFGFEVDCTWEGTLEALVRFLYALESQDVSMDLDQLSVSTVSGSKDKLKGNFSVKCAYCREAEAGPGQNEPARAQEAEPAGTVVK